MYFSGTSGLKFFVLGHWSKRRATYRVRQVAWFPWRMHVDRGPSAGLIDVALLFGTRYQYERLLAVVHEELGADHDELVDPMMR